MIGDRWWEGASIYHVYVRSWQDSDGDGFGDLAGVIARLDYLRWLGVDGLWLSPIMSSPDDDWGYDVADYFGVHRELGDLDDLDRLIEAASARGIRIVVDLVPNHTSSAHPWFVEARSGPGASLRDWYVWADPDASGGPPNNWLDATGASAWTMDPSGQYYLHNFLPSQPDLNWWNPGVSTTFENILKFWLDRGVAGFRIDVAHALFKDRELRDDPVGPGGPSAGFGRIPVHSKNRPEVHGVYRAWRRLVDQYQPGRLLLGETWVFEPERLASFYGADDELHLGFNFAFVFAPFTAEALRRVVRDTLAALPEGACPVWVGSNHDVSRFATRWGRGEERRARLGLTILCTLPGTLVLYYGDELGLTDVDVDPDLRRDPMTWRATDGRFNRDRARTPMPWDTGPHCGFTDDTAVPWLPLGDRSSRSVVEQRADPASMLWLSHRLLTIRRTSLAPGVADYEELASDRDCWVFRSGPLVIAANFSDEEGHVDLPVGDLVLSSIGALDGRLRGGAGTELAPWEALVLEVGT